MLDGVRAVMGVIHEEAGREVLVVMGVWEREGARYIWQSWCMNEWSYSWGFC